MGTSPSSLRATQPVNKIHTYHLEHDHTLNRVKHLINLISLTVMESDLSSSDAALRMPLVEDVELLESGIFTSCHKSPAVCLRVRV